ncbi:MAG: lamin tail domain-containing protein [Candidatus Thermoplasmatota archaeon]
MISRNYLRKSAILAVFLLLIVSSSIPVLSHDEERDRGGSEKIEDLSGATDIVISEVFYKPGGGYSEEWLEIANSGSTEIDITGWKLKVANYTKSIYPTQNGSVGDPTLQPGEYAVLAPNASAFLEEYDFQGNLYDCAHFWLSDYKDLNIQLHSTDQMVDDLTYNGTTWPGSSSYSMELVNLSKNNSLKSNWATSEIFGGTPGKLNSRSEEGSADYSPKIWWSWREPYMVDNNTSPVVTAKVTDDSQIQSVELNYRIDGGTFQSTIMVDDGAGEDEKADDDNHTGRIPEQEPETEVEYYVEVTDDTSQSTTDPLKAPTDTYSYTVISSVLPDLVINEVFYDPMGPYYEENDEWIEIKNVGSDPIDMSLLDLNIDGYKKSIYWAEEGSLELSQGDFAVLSPNITGYQESYPEFSGNLLKCEHFWLENASSIQLLRGDRVIDQVEYNWTSWPSQEGYSMELKNVSLDNSKASNWAVSLTEKGTPGEINSVVDGEDDGDGDNTTGDQDNDGMPDEWENQYGLDPTDPSDADGDPDGDGFKNLEEYEANTDPLNSDSHPEEDKEGDDEGGIPKVVLYFVLVVVVAMIIIAVLYIHFKGSEEENDEDI